MFKSDWRREPLQCQIDIPIKLKDKGRKLDIKGASDHRITKASETIEVNLVWSINLKGGLLDFSRTLRAGKVLLTKLYEIIYSSK